MPSPETDPIRLGQALPPRPPVAESPPPEAGDQSVRVSSGFRPTATSAMPHVITAMLIAQFPNGRCAYMAQYGSDAHTFQTPTPIHPGNVAVGETFTVDERAAALRLPDRQIVSQTTLLRGLGLDWEVEQRRMQEEVREVEALQAEFYAREQRLQPDLHREQRTLRDTRRYVAALLGESEDYRDGRHLVTGTPPEPVAIAPAAPSPHLARRAVMLKKQKLT